MTEHDPETGLFKQLVLIYYALRVAIELKIEQWRDSETFWWWVAGFFFAVGVYLLTTVILK